jgi:ADP-ribose pyrophosphatase YjhB (NUDIX family)
MKLPLTDEEFDFIYSKVPRLNVEIIVKTEKGIVLTKRNIVPWKGFWHIPGGRLYMGEAFDDAILRIAKRELGVGVGIDKMVGSIVYPSIAGQGHAGWPVGIAFVTHIVSGTLKSSDQDDEIAVFNKIPEHTIPEQIAFLQDLREKGNL